jgi:hypothetical protein
MGRICVVIDIRLLKIIWGVARQKGFEVREKLDFLRLAILATAIIFLCILVVRSEFPESEFDKFCRTATVPMPNC